MMRQGMRKDRRREETKACQVGEIAVIKRIGIGADAV
jgi:hypothetical protein